MSSSTMSLVFQLWAYGLISTVRLYANIQTLELSGRRSNEIPITSISGHCPMHWNSLWQGCKLLIAPGSKFPPCAHIQYISRMTAHSHHTHLRHTCRVRNVLHVRKRDSFTWTVAQNMENRVLNKVFTSDKQNRKTQSNAVYRSCRMRDPVAAQHFVKLESQLRSCGNLKTCVYTNTSANKQSVYEFSLI